MLAVVIGALRHGLRAGRLAFGLGPGPCLPPFAARDRTVGRHGVQHIADDPGRADLVRMLLDRIEGGLARGRGEEGEVLFVLRPGIARDRLRHEHDRLADLDREADHPVFAQHGRRHGQHDGGVVALRGQDGAALQRQHDLPAVLAVADQPDGALLVRHRQDVVAVAELGIRAVGLQAEGGDLRPAGGARAGKMHLAAARGHHQGLGRGGRPSGGKGESGGETGQQAAHGLVPPSCLPSGCDRASHAAPPAAARQRRARFRRGGCSSLSASCGPGGGPWRASGI